MSALAACTHKSEWICKSCAKCSSCCRCEVDPWQPVHINTSAAAVALQRHARMIRKKYSADPDDPPDDPPDDT